MTDWVKQVNEYHLAGMSYSKIAKLMGMTKNKVLSAHRKMRFGMDNQKFYQKKREQEVKLPFDDVYKGAKMTDIVNRLRAESPTIFTEGHLIDDFDAIDLQRKEAADEIERLREVLRYIWAHGDENGKIPYSWGQEYAERFIRLAKQEWERK